MALVSKILVTNRADTLSVTWMKLLIKGCLQKTVATELQHKFAEEINILQPAVGHQLNTPSQG